MNSPVRVFVAGVMLGTLAALLGLGIARVRFPLIGFMSLGVGLVVGVRSAYHYRRHGSGIDEPGSGASTREDEAME